MAVNQDTKNAMKRLAKDLLELQQQPVENVSAAPLDENMLEWHCNFKHDDIIYHLILFLPEKYPYMSPSAEFVPQGFRYNSGATMPGKKGTKVCLNIFADFAYIHTEWKDEKGLGWSPGYTVQTILMNVVAFLAETQSGESSWMKDTSAHNMKLSKAFKCEDCGHTYTNPYPSLEVQKSSSKLGAASQAVGKNASKGPQIIDYISKEPFSVQAPKSDSELYGYGLIVSGPSNRPALTTPCEFLQLASFEGMKKAIGKVHSVLKEEIKFFLPLYIHPRHGEQIKSSIENTLTEIAVILPKCKAGKTPIAEMIIKTIPNLMSATVVEFSKGTQHTSDNSLNGYFALHRLFLWALETYPDLENIVEQKLKDFIADESNRTKKACPHIGEWLMLLSGSWKHRWEDAADAYLSESNRRQVMWYVKDDAKLGMLDTDMAYRLKHTLERTAVGRKLLAFQVLFLDIAMPKGKSRKELIKRYDDNLGFPTDDMVKQMKESVETINNMKSYADWYKVLKLEPPSEKDQYNKLVKCVEYAIWTDGYNWSFWKTGGGWGEVLRRYKPYTPKDKKADSEEKDGKSKEKGKSPIKEAVIKGKGRGKKNIEPEPMKVSDTESDSEEVVKPKGRGSKLSAKVEPAKNPSCSRSKKVKHDKLPAKASKGVKGGKVDEEEGKSKGRGRGRGKRSADEAFDTKPVGRGGKKKKR